jgi:molybdate transport system substrate-binding protein
LLTNSPCADTIKLAGNGWYFYQFVVFLKLQRNQSKRRLLVMKKIASLLLALAMVLSLCACSSSNATTTTHDTANADNTGATSSAEGTPDADAETEGEKVELTVFAAASLTETLTEIADLYAVEAPNVTLSFNFDSSGTLQTQIEEGAVCDLFLSAGQKQMDALEEESLIVSDSRIDLLGNQVTLAVAEGNPANVQSFDDMAERLQSGDLYLAIGNSDVPVGQYTQKIFEYYNIDESAVAGSLTYGTNVKEVTTQVAEGSADCGIIYCTDAYSEGLEVVGTATDEMCGQVIYPAAVLGGSEYQAEAQAFLDFLTTEACSEIFAEVGFAPVSQAE